MFVHRSPSRNRESILKNGLLLNNGKIYLSKDFEYFNGCFHPHVRDFWEVKGVRPKKTDKPGEYILTKPVPPSKLRLIKEI